MNPSVRPSSTLTGHEPAGAQSVADRSQYRDTLRRLLRRFQPSGRVASCAQSSAGPWVVAHCDAEGRAGWSGTMVCERWHSCPVCSARIAVGRADELGEVARRHRAEVPGAQVYLWTVTLRHERWHSLADLLDVMTLAWRYMGQGRGARYWRTVVGWLGMVRGVEVRWSPRHGWHPHLHVMVLGRKRREKRLEGLRRWLAERWMTCVARAAEACELDAIEAGEEIGGRFEGLVPDEIHGSDFKAGTDAKYIAKLGWEVAGAWTKDGHQEGSEGPWDLAARAVHEPAARDLWTEYAEAMHGRRQLTWSRGLRPRNEATDSELAQREEAPAVAQIDRDSYWSIERAGLAWWLARYLGADPEGAAEWCAQNGLTRPQWVDPVTREPSPRHSWAGHPRTLHPWRPELTGLSAEAAAAQVRRWCRYERCADRRWSDPVDLAAKVGRGEHVPLSAWGAAAPKLPAAPEKSRGIRRKKPRILGQSPPVARETL